MPARVYGYRGSRRKLKEIRWKRGEIVSLILLLLLASLLSIFVAIWFEAHHGLMVD